MVAKTISFVILSLMLVGCHKEEGTEDQDVDFKQRMRAFVTGISQYSKSIHPNFLVVPQNGIELVTKDGEFNGELAADYLNAIDGNGQEDLFYGFENDDQASPGAETTYLRNFLNKSVSAGKTILVTDYCSTPANVTNSYQLNSSAGYVSYAAAERGLNVIPSSPTPIYNENPEKISQLSDVRNFLYLINPSNFNSKQAFINAVNSTNYDLLIMDLFFTDGTAFTSAEVGQLRNKANGGKRLVLSYMSIGEAENYRDYWQAGWKTNPPAWLAVENPNWPGNFKVKYWHPEWQNIIYGNNSSYLKRILDADFDGVYLDIIDAFEYFEK